MYYHQPMVKYQQPVQQMHQQIQLQQVQFQPIHQIQQLQQLQQKAQLVPVQFIHKPYYVTQQQAQPQAMIIIAQPALLPQSLVYNNPTQQLLNYFHSNPQARYQLLHGNYHHNHQLQAQAAQAVQAGQAQAVHPTQAQAVQPTATYMHPVLASPSIGNYILAAAPQYQQVSAPVAAQHQLVAHTSAMPAQAMQYTTQQTHQVQQVQPQQQVQQQQPAQLSSIAHLAQLAAQQYVSNQMKTAPAIVTGFEHFTPEQQAQIKAQLSSHLGTGFHAVANPNQYSAKYVAEQDANKNNNNNNNFVPSPQVKTESLTTVSSQPADVLKARFMKVKH
jgi:hypothetical protein